jgi:hypothetical protein
VERSRGRVRGLQALRRQRPCSYGDITYERLRDGSGLQWGGERLYADGSFFAARTRARPTAATC